MSNNIVIKRRWGVFTLSIIMVSLHLLGSLGSGGGGVGIYGFFWAYAAYLALKGDIKTISYWLGWLIVISACGLVLVSVLASGDTVLLSLGMNKAELIVNGLVLLVIKGGLWLYLSNEISKSQGRGISDAGSAISTQPLEASPPPVHSLPIVEKYAVAGPNQSSDTIMKGPTKDNDRSYAAERGDGLPVDEDAIYEAISNEVESASMKMGLWTRLYADNDGDEVKTKVAYIRHRAADLIDIEKENLRRHRTEQMRQSEMKRLREEAKMSTICKVCGNEVAPYQRYEHPTDGVILHLNCQGRYTPAE